MARRKKQNLKNANGMGCIIYLGDNRRKPWMFRAQVGLKKNDKGKVVPDFYREYFETRKQAENFQEEYIAIKQAQKVQARAERLLAVTGVQPINYAANVPQQIVQAPQVVQIPAQPVTPTFDEVYQKWYAFKVKYGGRKKRPAAPKTLESYTVTYNNLSEIVNIPIGDITVQDMQSILDDYSIFGLSCINNFKKVLNGVYEYAINKMELQIENKVPKLDFIYNPDGKKIEHKEFTKEEIQLMWDNVGKIKDIEWFLILIYTGMRPSEPLQIPVENVHLDERYIIGGIKTDAGRDRIVPICEKIYPLIKMKCGKKWLFENNGERFTRQTLGVRLNEITQQLGIQDHTPHDCRDTFISMMDRAGANKVCIQLIVGHVGKDVTEKHYIKKNLKDLLKEVNKINDLEKVYEEKAEE